MAKEKTKKKTQVRKRVAKKKEAKRKAPAIVEKEIAAVTPKVEEKAPEVQVEEKAPEKVEVVGVEAKKAPKPKPEQEGFYFATGRRKTSVARVKLVPGAGNVFVNQKPLSKYVAGRKVLEVMVKKPLSVTDTISRYDVAVKVAGGGVSSQAGAISHGIARALLGVNPDLRAKLKPEGLLTRDPRMKERKKYGRKRARKRFQYSKR